MGCGGTVLYTGITSWSHPAGKTPLQSWTPFPRVEQEPAVCPRPGWWHGLHQEGDRGDPSLYSHRSSAQVWASQCPEWDMQTWLGVQLKATKGCRACSTSPTRSGWGSRDCLGRRKLRETLINTYHQLKRGSKEDGARLLSVMPSDRTRGSGHMWGSIWAHEHTFTVRLTENCSRWPRQTVSFLGDPKPPGHRSGQHGLDGMAGAGRLDNMTSRGPSQPQPAWFFK